MIMNERYDAIVIGAGNGGLTAAVGLAQKGARTLLLEKQSIPGGFATSFVPNGYEFEGSLHHLSGLGDKDNPGPLYHVLEDIGIVEDIPYLPIKKMRMMTGPYDISLPVGKEEFKEALKNYFPEEADGLDRLFEVAWGVWDEFQQIFKFNNDLVDPWSKFDLDASKEKYPLFFKYAFRNAFEVYSEFLKNPYCMIAFCVTGLYSGPLNETSFLDQIYWIVNYFSYPMSHIRGGSQTQSLALARKFEEYGGVLKCSEGVARILTENGEVTGVLTVKGNTYYTNNIVANVNPVVVYGEMMDPQDVPAGTLEQYNGFDIAGGFLMLYLGLDCSAEELGVDHALEWVIDPLDPGRMPLFIASRDCVTPDLPENFGHLDVGTISNPEEWLRMSPEQYLQNKYDFAEKLLTEAERVIPGIREHIVEMDFATPYTSSRFSSSPKGSAGGLSTVFANQVLYPEDYNNKVKGLWLNNTGVSSHSGFQPTLSYGYALGKHVAEQLKN